MEPTTLHTTKTSAPKLAAEPAWKSTNKPPTGPPAERGAEPLLELDRRGKPLPPRHRVGGIITPQ
jgi:hypothetical protein